MNAERDEATDRAIDALWKLFRRGRITRTELVRRLRAALPEERSKMVTLRMTEAEYAALKTRAQRSGMSMNAYLLAALQGAVEDEID